MKPVDAHPFGLKFAYIGELWKSNIYPSPMSHVLTDPLRTLKSMSLRQISRVTEVGDRTSMMRKKRNNFNTESK